jgi:hypothetical protein
MGTKLNPSEFDCYANALPDEPMFVLLARDPSFFDLVLEWAARRRRLIQHGHRPASDLAMVEEAEACAFKGQQWRFYNDGKWRKPDPTTNESQQKG